MKTISKNHIFQKLFSMNSPTILMVSSSSGSVAAAVAPRSSTFGIGVVEGTFPHPRETSGAGTGGDGCAAGGGGGGGAGDCTEPQPDCCGAAGT